MVGDDYLMPRLLDHRFIDGGFVQMEIRQSVFHADSIDPDENLVDKNLLDGLDGGIAHQREPDAPHQAAGYLNRDAFAAAEFHGHVDAVRHDQYSALPVKAPRHIGRRRTGGECDCLTIPHQIGGRQTDSSLCLGLMMNLLLEGRIVGERRVKQRTDRELLLRDHGGVDLGAPAGAGRDGQIRRKLAASAQDLPPIHGQPGVTLA